MFAGVCLRNIWNILIYIFFFMFVVFLVFSLTQTYLTSLKNFSVYIFFFSKVTVSIFKSECDKALNGGEIRRVRERKSYIKERKWKYALLHQIIFFLNYSALKKIIYFLRLIMIDFTNIYFFLFSLCFFCFIFRSCRKKEDNQ